MEVIQSARIPRSRSSRSFSSFVAVLLCALASLISGANADAGSEARAAFERGVEASRAARWQDARREFERSRDLVVKPSTLFNLAVADVRLGLGREALVALDAFERIATDQHAEMLERAYTLRAEAERLADAAKPAGERVRTLIEPPGLPPEGLRLFQQGRDAYADGDDKLAIASFERAHRLSPRAELLFDIGVVADRMRDDERAVAAFRGFVSALPDVPEAALAKKRIERLEQALREKQPTAVVVAEGSVPSEVGEPARPNPRAPRALLAVGAVLTAGALGSTFWWIDGIDRLDACRRPNEVCLNEAQIERHEGAAMGLTLGLGIAGAALLTGGAVWLARQKPRATIDSQLSRERFLLTARIAF